MNKTQDEQLLFEIKQKFLREIPHPTIIRKQAERLAKYQGLEFTFVIQKAKEERSLNEFLESYLRDLMPLKLKIANSPDSESLLEGLHELWSIQTSLIYQLSIFDVDFKDEIFAEIKMSSPFDAYQLLKFLRESNIDQSEINGYLCAAFENLDSEPISIFTESVVRAKKIIDYEQVR